MNEQQRVAYVFARSVAAMAEIEAMKNFNRYEHVSGKTIPYNKKAFLDVIDKYGLGHNDLMTELTGH